MTYLNKDEIMKKILFSYMIILMVLLSASIAFTDDRYIDNGGCITDTKTGLIWTTDTDLLNGKSSNEEALSKLAELNSEKLCGVWWYIPTPEELNSILDSYPNLIDDWYHVKYPLLVSPPSIGHGGMHKNGKFDKGSYENHFIAVGK
jgi:hypothetical protein